MNRTQEQANESAFHKGATVFWIVVGVAVGAMFLIGLIVELHQRKLRRAQNRNQNGNQGYELSDEPSWGTKRTWYGRRISPTESA